MNKLTQLYLMIKFQWKVNRYISSLITTTQGVSVTAMDDILYSRTVQDCERFCDDVSKNEENLTKREEMNKKCSGTSIQLPEFLSAGRSLLSQVIKAFFILVNILTRKAKSLQFCPNVDFDKTFSGDDSVTLPDSTQPEEPVSKTWKRIFLEKMQNSCFKGFELQGEGLHPINLRRRDVHLREDNRTLLTHS